MAGWAWSGAPLDGCDGGSSVPAGPVVGAEAAGVVGVGDGGAADEQWHRDAGVPQRRECCCGGGVALCCGHSDHDADEAFGVVGGDGERCRWGVGAEVVDFEASGSERVGEDRAG